MSNVPPASQLAQHTFWKHNPFQISDNLLYDAQIHTELVFVVLPTASPLVAGLSVQNTEHGKISQMVVHTATHQRTDLRAVCYRPIPRVDLFFTECILYFRREVVPKCKVVADANHAWLCRFEVCDTAHSSCAPSAGTLYTPWKAHSPTVLSRIYVSTPKKNNTGGCILLYMTDQGLSSWTDDLSARERVREIATTLTQPRSVEWVRKEAQISS